MEWGKAVYNRVTGEIKEFETNKDTIVFAWAHFREPWYIYAPPNWQPVYAVTDGRYLGSVHGGYGFVSKEDAEKFYAESWGDS